MILGGSTNAVLHLIAMAHSVGIELTIDDFQSVSDRVPFIADLKPSGKYVMEDVYKIGGIPSKRGECVSRGHSKNWVTPRNNGLLDEAQLDRRQ